MADPKEPQQNPAGQWRINCLSAARLSLEAGPAGEAPPKNDGDYLFLNFRALSAILVIDHAVDFCDQAMLQAGVPMLLRRPVLTDHRYSINAVVGTVVKTWWGNDDGLGAPGINCQVRLNRKALPANLLAEIEADPPLHLAVSTTPFYEWRQSHPALSPRQFWGLVGQEVDGELVRVVVTKMLEMPEVSLVWAGADPQARLLAMHKPLNGSETMSGANSQAGGAPAPTALSLSALLPLATRLGLGAEQVDTEAKALAAMTAKVAEIMPLAEAGRAHLAARREECLRLAALSAPDHKTPEHLTSLVNGSGLETVEALIAQFGGKAAAAFTAVCPKCQTAVPIRSSLEAPAPDQGEDQYTQAGLRMAKSVGNGNQAQG
jgi:hypothetical protein